MQSRIAYFVSGSAHALLAWALASANDLLRPEFHVRAGHAVPLVSQATLASFAPPLDSRIQVEREPVFEMPPPVFPEPPPERPELPPAADLDERPIERLPVDEPQRRRPQPRELAALPPEPMLERLPDDPSPARTPLVEYREQLLPEPFATPPLPERRPVIEPRPQPTPIEVAEVLEPVEPQPKPQPMAIAADTPQGAKVDHLPKRLPNNREPTYPEELRRRQIGGRVLLDVQIDSAGRVVKVEVARSSGQPLLDAAAVDAIQTWQFEPARRGSVAVAFAVQIPVSFSIRN